MILAKCLESHSKIPSEIFLKIPCRFESLPNGAKLFFWWDRRISCRRFEEEALQNHHLPGLQTGPTGRSASGVSMRE
jgi:hypothetical protein